MGGSGPGALESCRSVQSGSRGGDRERRDVCAAFGASQRRESSRRLNAASTGFATATPPGVPTLCGASIRCMSALILAVRLHGVFAAIATAPPRVILLALNMIVERDGGPRSTRQHPTAEANENDSADHAADGGVAGIDNFLHGEGRQSEDDEIVQHEKDDIEPDVGIVQSDRQIG